MRYRSSREAFELPQPDGAESPTDQGTGLAKAEYQVLRRPSVEASPNGVFKLHPLASRVQHSVGTSETGTAKPHEARAGIPPEERAEPTRPVVTLVSPWTPDPIKEQEPQVDEESEVEEEPIFEEPPVEEAVDEEAEPVTSSERLPKVIVVDRLGKLSMDLGTAVEGMVPEPEILKLDRPTEIVEVAEAEDPDVIVFGLDEVNGAGLKRLAQIHRAQPKIVILLSDNRRKTWSAAQMAASGASDFLPVNPSRSRLRTKLTAALHTAEQLRVESVVVTERVVTERVVVQQAVPAVPQPRAPLAPATLGRVFTVASASGGSGKTMVATNLATYLVKATGGKVLLIDLDLQFGEVAPSLHLHPRRTIENLVEDPEDLSETLVEHASGFKALCAPTDPLAGERIGPNEVLAILEVAQREFDFIVVDTPPSLNETCLAVFDQSEKLIIIANMDVPSLKNMRRYLETVEKLSAGATEGQSVLMVNRVESGIGLDLKAVEQLFPQGFLAVLPMTKEIPWSTNMGVPILQANPKAEVTRELADGFAKLTPPTAAGAMPWSRHIEAGRRSGLLGLKKGRS